MPRHNDTPPLNGTKPEAKPAKVILPKLPAQRQSGAGPWPGGGRANLRGGPGHAQTAKPKPGRVPGRNG